MKRYAIIVAGGSGKRMGVNIPKQFLKLEGVPILMHTLQAFHLTDFSIELIVTLPQEEIQFWNELCEWHYNYTPHRIVPGGNTRFHSVKNALDYVQEESLVAVHDGVRPFVSKEIILEAYQLAEAKGNAITSVAMKDSVRRVETDKNQNIDRNSLRAIQTPQTFQSTILKAAYEQTYKEEFTDDASVVEAYGQQIHLIEGDYKNIKITTPEDLLIAEALLKAK
ncbi:2-C-methyl-D-erythritol 4-phosphate cytidylyltransferase [Marivirga lumbricoides]|uniref:2-C-methyl-D-erythritol 4-phosphate cytidylyltransferase n=1 Tax=Marivirga lumbricoides TaxID=1046115 RepID=A0A2T4DJV2_9BACT|nr:2-C-methyl-D-erythritol 4-phosphate cytidylyltransferase [Marivirga lumbricoides]GGC41495.1 2-C-methyl-D-erythritol 4-phosphate cytidylyltransferase [Marivirga lumbricoides]